MDNGSVRPLTNFHLDSKIVALGELNTHRSVSAAGQFKPFPPLLEAFAPRLTT
jgi:hypothetical protein